MGITPTPKQFNHKRMKKERKWGRRMKKEKESL